VFQDPATAPKQLGLEPFIHPTAQVRDSRFGAYCEIGARTKVAESSFGDYSYVVNDADIIYSEIGRFCSIAAQTRINPGNHPLDRVALNHFTYRSSAYGLGEDDVGFFDWRRSYRVTLGHDVWIGHGAIVLPGVSIGTGARSVRARWSPRTCHPSRSPSACRRARCASASRRRSSRHCSASPGGSGSAPSSPTRYRTSAGLMPRRFVANTTPPDVHRVPMCQAQPATRLPGRMRGARKPDSSSRSGAWYRALARLIKLMPAARHRPSDQESGLA
jgi:acetyltransferase-like isoleucine patch superfamily enzyme